MRFFDRNDSFPYEHLEHKSTPELVALKRQTEQRLNALRRKEPAIGGKGSAAYCEWIGRNVQCIKNLDKVRGEILRRRQKALQAGVSAFSVGGKRLNIPQREGDKQLHVSI